MITVDESIMWENYVNESFVEVYHGGKRFDEFNTDIKPTKKGKFESGIGINCTTHYNTARKYAKGSRVVSKIYLDKSMTDIKDVNVPIKELIDFINGNRIVKRKAYLTDIYYSIDSHNLTDTIPANYVMNLLVNNGIGGTSGLLINDFLVSHGVDVSIESQSGNEDWVIIHNPKIIKKVRYVDPKTLTSEDYELPKIEEQL